MKKVVIIIFYLGIMLNLFSQNMLDIQVSTIVTDTMKISFNIKMSDTITLKVYNRRGIAIKTVYDKQNLTRGYYLIEFSTNNWTADIYILLLKSTKDEFAKQIVKIGDSLSSGQSADLYRITIYDTVKINIYDTTQINIIDTCRIMVNDTLKILEIDSIKEGYPTIINKSIILNKSAIVIKNGYLDLNNIETDFFELFDIQGTLLRKELIKNKLLDFRYLEPKVYIVVLYKNNNIIKSLKVVKL
jgi:hypothetical protein